MRLNDPNSAFLRYRKTAEGDVCALMRLFIGHDDHGSRCLIIQAKEGAPGITANPAWDEKGTVQIEFIPGMACLLRDAINQFLEGEQ